MKKLKITIFSIFVLLAIVMLALQSEWSKALAMKFLQDALKESGYQVKIGTFAGTVPHAIDLKDVRIKSDTIDIHIDSLDTRLSIWALFKKELLFTDVLAQGVRWQHRPGGPVQLGQGKGLTFSLRVKHLQMTQVSIPDFFLANFEGSLRLGKKNKDFFADLSMTRPDFPESQARMLVYIDENGFMRMKGSLDTSTLKALPYELAQWDASAHIQFALRGKGNFSGTLRGTIAPHSLPIECMQSWMETEWKIGARISRRESIGWSIFRLSAATDQLKAVGTIDLDLNGNFQQADLAFQTQEPNCHAKVSLNAVPSGGLRVQADTSCPRLTMNAITLENVRAKGDIVWQQQSFKGHAAFAGSMFDKPWEGTTDLSGTQNSLHLTTLQLQGPTIALFSPDLEITSDRTLIGHTDFSVNSLHELSGDVYGTLQGQADWTSINGKQGLTANGQVKDFYRKELFVASASFEIALVDQAGPIHLSGQNIRWKQLSLDQFALDTSLGRVDSPFTLNTAGRFEHPLEVQLAGTWQYKNAQFHCFLKSLDGTFANRPLHLASATNFSLSQQELSVSGLDVTLADARFSLTWEPLQEHTNIELKLVHLPLEILPLHIALSGWMDASVTLKEKNQQVSGMIHVAIEPIKSETSNPATSIAAGTFEGTLVNEQFDGKGSFQIKGKPALALDLSFPLHVETWPVKFEPIYDQTMKGHLVLSGRTEELFDLFDLGNHRIEGDLTCDFNLKNTLQAPIAEGTLRFTNGYYENYMTGTRFLNIQAEGNANGDKFVLDSFTASDGKGLFTANGDIALLPTELFPFHFHVTFTHFNLTQIDLMTADADGNIEIIGNLKESKATGQIDVIESSLHIPDHIPRTFPDLVVVYKNATIPVKPPTPPITSSYPIHLDLKVKAPDGVFIDGRGLHSEWKGNFQINGTFTDLAALGKLELIKGEFLFSGRYFKLLEGNLSFAGKEHQMPYLNLAAALDVQDISIIARLKGPLNNPQLTLQSTPPLPLSTLMSYLLFGHELAEINSFQALQLANSLSSLAGQGPDVLENTRKALGVDRLNIVSLPSGSDDLENRIAVQVGKYISEGVLVSLTQGAEESARNISISIELKGGWTIQLESDQIQEQGKLTIKWNHNL